jgi:hypothetical protein
MYEYFPIEKEHKLVNDYIGSHPFPSEDEFIYKLKSNIELYSHLYYTYTKTLYENITNEIKCRRIGKNIDKMAGFDGMKLIYCMVRDLSPLKDSQSTFIRLYYYNLTIYWDGVGYWEH